MIVTNYTTKLSVDEVVEILENEIDFENTDIEEIEEIIISEII